MPHLAAGLRFPHLRVLLPRTKLAYVHVRNLLTDAKRDRSGRVHGYVAIWLPEEFVLMYLQRGELVNATATADATHWRAIPIADAVARVPAEPEYGELCYHEVEDGQLACMHHTQAGVAEPFAEGFDPFDPKKLFPMLAASTYDGVVELVADGAVSYLLFRDGAVNKAYLADNGIGHVVDRVKAIFRQEHRRLSSVRRFPGVPRLPVQASPALVQVYWDLCAQLVRHLGAEGMDDAPAVAERARLALEPLHPALQSFSATGRNNRYPVADADEVTAAVAAWNAHVIAATRNGGGPPPESLLRELTRERRHALQSAGYFDQLPWTVSW